MQKAPDLRLGVAYLRVSTEDQHLGPEAQRFQIEGWAARHGAAIVSWHTDQGVSGATAPGARPALLEAFASLREHGAGVLVASKRDRLAREVLHARTIAEMAKKLGAVVRTADEASGSPDEASGLLMNTMHDAFAEFERKVISERTKAALAVKKRRGERVGEVPFGWCIGSKGEMGLNRYEQDVISQVFSARWKGLSERTIGPVIAEDEWFSRAKKPLQKMQVRRILGGWQGDIVFRRTVEGTGQEIDVDLRQVIRASASPNIGKNIAPVAGRIATGQVDLHVISLESFSSPGMKEILSNVLHRFSGRTTEHRYLCALAWAVLGSSGKDLTAGGASDCNYVGGWADVAMKDGSLYVECGGLSNQYKVLWALQTGQNVMVVPHKQPNREGFAYLFNAHHGASDRKLVIDGKLRLPADGTYRHVDETGGFFEKNAGKGLL